MLKDDISDNLYYKRESGEANAYPNSDAASPSRVSRANLSHGIVASADGPRCKRDDLKGLTEPP
jgi:hypothetical protein